MLHLKPDTVENHQAFLDSVAEFAFRKYEKPEQEHPDGRKDVLVGRVDLVRALRCRRRWSFRKRSPISWVSNASRR